MMDVKAAPSDVKDSCGGGESGRERNPGQQHTVDDSLHQEIETLIARLRRYVRQLTRDSAAANDLVQDRVARALGKIHLWEPEPIFAPGCLRSCTRHPPARRI
jgi:hypothetical protein